MNNKSKESLADSFSLEVTGSSLKIQKFNYDNK